MATPAHIGRTKGHSVEGLIQVIVDSRVSVGLMMLSVVLAMVTGVSAQALSDRIFRTGQLPFAHSRTLVVLAYTVTVAACQLLALAALDDARALEPEAIERAGAWFVIVATVFFASVFNADDLPRGETRVLPDLLFFAAASVALHQFGVVQRLTPEWSTERWISALVSFGACVALVAPFRQHFVDRRFDNRSPWVPGLLVGVSGTLPFLPVNIYLFAGVLPLATPAPEVLEELRSRVILSTVVMLALFHCLGWVLAWRASQRHVLAQRGLHRLEATLDALLDDRPAWTAVLDEEGRILAVGGHDQDASVALGDAKGERLVDALPPGLRDEVGDALQKARQTPGRAVVKRVTFETEKGREETVEFRLVDRTEDAQVRGVVFVIHVTTRIIAERRALLAQRRTHQQVFEHSPAPMLVIDPVRDLILDVNGAAVECYGWASEELVGSPVEKIIAPEDFAPADRFWASARDASVSTVHRRRDGTRFSVRLSSALYEEDGEERRLAMVENVDAFVRQNALRGGEAELLRSLIRSNDIGAWLGGLVHWLDEQCPGPFQAAALWLDPNRPLVVQRGVDPLIEARLHELDVERLRIELRSDGLRPLRGTADGPQPLWLMSIKDGDGTVLGFVGAGVLRGSAPSESLIQMLDLAAKLAAFAAERERAQQVLLRAQRMETLGRVSGSVAHDFNNLLTVILGEADMLRDALGEDPIAGASYGNLMDAANRASGIARRLLVMAHHRPRKVEVLPLDMVLRESRPWLSDLLVDGAAVELSLPDVGPSIECDRGQLEASLLNLVSNARDASPSSEGISLSLSLEALEGPTPVDSGTLGPGRYAVVSVSDSGHGIAPSLLPRVLDPFCTTKAGAGTGLGLPLVANFAAESGGGVALQSELGVGTTVSIWLPVVVPEREEGCEMPPEVEPPERIQKRILLVEDEPLVGRFVSRTLERDGFEVTLLDSADVACARLQDGETFDLVLTDIGLPGNMDGVDLARWIARERPEIAVLISSGLGGTGVPEDLERVVLPKPYDGRTLVAAVTEQLATHAAWVAAR